MSFQSTHVFEGHYYEAWRQVMITGISAHDEVYVTLSKPPSKTELELSTLPPHQWESHHHLHKRLQEKGKSFIFGHVSLPKLNAVIRSIRPCTTVRQLLAVLDEEYGSELHADEATTDLAFSGLCIAESIQSDCSNASKYNKKYAKKASIDFSYDAQEVVHYAGFVPEAKVPTNGKKSSQRKFMLATAASVHMTHRLENLFDVQRLPKPEKVICASRSTPLYATHFGKMDIKVRNRHGQQSKANLLLVLFVPDLWIDLLSVKKIVSKGELKVQFVKDYADVIRVDTERIFFSAKLEGHAPFVTYEKVEPIT